MKIVLAAAVVILAATLTTAFADRALLRTPPDALPSHRNLVAFARIKAKLPFAMYCAECHGAGGRGVPVKGASDLRDAQWLHGAGDVSDIERTILFGVRSGDPRARNVADMPAFLFEGRLSRVEIGAVSEYILALGGKPHDTRQIWAGKAIYEGKGVCYDCHGIGGAGTPDFGAPSLRALNLIHGSGRAMIAQSIVQGRHGVCPAWIGHLGAATIRAIAVDLYFSSHAAAR